MEKNRQAYRSPTACHVFRLSSRLFFMVITFGELTTLGSPRFPLTEPITGLSIDTIRSLSLPSSSARFGPSLSTAKGASIDHVLVIMRGLWMQM